MCLWDNFREFEEKFTYTHCFIGSCCCNDGKSLTEIFILSFQICLLSPIVLHNNSRLKTIKELLFKVKGLSKKNVMACSLCLLRQEQS